MKLNYLPRTARLSGVGNEVELHGGVEQFVRTQPLERTGES